MPWLPRYAHEAHCLHDINPGFLAGDAEEMVSQDSPAYSNLAPPLRSKRGLMLEQVLKATEGRDRAQSSLDAASAAVEAAARELAGAEAGDGRDESNRSLQERLADAQRSQVIHRLQC